ncbi:hypothetical protein HMPREF9997_01114 [Corynebacterium durum F0235]|uniref:Uncharacterized protein n=1 Tax=Corynebacterium durum F0235 TaxID=1035195 RepID=L1MI47_9CORY|nr:hypothetical protein HMPREF9997_01114 [Corynebacterium durum F0235]
MSASNKQLPHVWWCVACFPTCPLHTMMCGLAWLSTSQTNPVSRHS